MYDRPKGNFSFLIAFAKQLAQALDSHRDDDVGIACESLAVSLELLNASLGSGAGEDPGGADEGVDDDDAPGDDTPLGAALARIAELERSAAAMDSSSERRRLHGGTSEASAGELALGGKRRKSAILKKVKNGKK